MSDWSEVTLGDISTQKKGINYKSENYCLKEFGHHFITIKCFVKGGGYQPKGIKYYNGPSTKSDLLKPNDILFSVTDLTRAGDIVGSPLKVPFFGGKSFALASMDCMKISPNINLCDASFLYHRLMLSDIRRQMVAYSAGSTVLHLDTKQVPKMRVKIPNDKVIQKKIANILDTTDEAIKKTEALIEKYQQIKIGLMQDLFTRGIAADGKLRPTREQAPELYHKTKIGWIPRDWDLSHLKSMSKDGVQHLRTGPFGSALKGEHWVEEGHPVITIGALGEGEFIESELLYIGDKDVNRLRDFKLKLDDVVFSRVADVGRSVVIKEEQVGWIMSSNLMRISLDPQKMMAEFLQHQLSSYSLIKKQIRCKVNSAGRDVANSDILNSLWFIQPKHNEQLSIVKRAEEIDVRLKTEQSLAHKLRLQKSGLMDDLLTGKKLVTVDEPEAAHV
ncbi:restriction endonuclease subunit S [Shewanella sp. 125m-7]